METSTKAILMIMIIVTGIGLGVATQWLLTHHPVDHEQWTTVTGRHHHHGIMMCGKVAVPYTRYHLELANGCEDSVSSYDYDHIVDGTQYLYKWTTWELNQP